MKQFNIIKDDSIYCLDKMDIGYMDYSSDEETHTHSFVEIVCIVDGTGEHVVNGNRIFCSRGSLIAMDPWSKHSIENIKPYKYYTVRLFPNFISDELSESSGIKELFEYFGFNIEGDHVHLRITDEETFQKIEEMFFEILDEGVNKPKGYVRVAEAKVREILVNIGRLYPKYLCQNQKKDVELNEIINYIEENCYKKISLEDTAARFGYEPSYFSRKLKNYLGFSFKQVLLRKRLAKSISYLWGTDDTIEEIISKCGFSKKSYYYKAFEEQYGIKPNKMRWYASDIDNYRKEFVNGKKSKTDTFEE